MFVYTTDGVIAWGYVSYVERVGYYWCLGVCLLCVGRVLISDYDNLARARGWCWKLPRDKWWPLAVTGENWAVGRLILSKTDALTKKNI